MAEEDHAGLLAYLADVGACEGGRTMREVRSASQNPDDARSPQCFSKCGNAAGRAVAREP